MIVIPRKKGESIVIGDEIVITVIEVKDDDVKFTVERLTDDGDGQTEAPEVVLPEEQLRKRPR
jgi:hypothetical protein